MIRTNTYVFNFVLQKFTKVEVKLKLDEEDDNHTCSIFRSLGRFVFILPLVLRLCFGRRLVQIDHHFYFIFNMKLIFSD